MKIEKNEELFSQWKDLGRRIGLLMPTIVQNDIDISFGQVQEHFRLARNLYHEFDALIGKTSTYILEGEKE